MYKYNILMYKSAFNFNVESSECYSHIQLYVVSIWYRERNETYVQIVLISCRNQGIAVEPPTQRHLSDGHGTVPGTP